MTTNNSQTFKNYHVHRTRHKIHEIQQRYYISIDPTLLKDLDPQLMWVVEEPTPDGGIMVRSLRRQQEEQQK